MSTEPIVDMDTNLTSPPHHYEEVDGSPAGRPAAYLQVLPEPLELRQAQESKRQRREARRAGMREERERVEREGRRMQTPQRSPHTRSFQRAGWRAGQETYQGIAQPEPPPLPITGHGSESHLAEEAMETSSDEVAGNLGDVEVIRAEDELVENFGSDKVEVMQVDDQVEKKVNDEVLDTDNDEEAKRKEESRNICYIRSALLKASYSRKLISS